MSIQFRRSLPVACALLFACQSGCALQEQWANVWHDVKLQATPQTTDRRDFTEDVEEDWSFVGDEGRAEQTSEQVDDDWYRKFVMSEKARQIEGNLGYE